MKMAIVSQSLTIIAIQSHTLIEKRKKKDGKDIQLTIDAKVQKSIYNNMKMIMAQVLLSTLKQVNY